METKELLERLEKDLIKIEKEGAELSGGYLLIVDLQKDIRVKGKLGAKFLAGTVMELFEILKERDKYAGRKLLVMLCVQTLVECLQEKE